MIELSGISKTFRRGSQTLTALRSVDLTVQRGEAVAIVGESGAGKTTLARILLKLTDPSEGTYRFDGRDVLLMSAADTRRWRRRVQAVFQNPYSSLNPRLRVDVLVTEPLDATTPLGRPERARRAGALLEMVGLPASMASRYPHQLSGGQRQRVAIARALSSEPDVLVLDEPLSALDVSVRAQVLNLIVEIRRRLGMTYIYVTHDLNTVSHLCDRAYVLYSGRVFEEVQVRRLIDRPDNPYSRALLDSVPSTTRRHLPPLQTIVAVSQTSAMACAFLDRCPHAQQVCAASEPELLQLGGAWRSRCHFAGIEKPAPRSV